MRSLRVFVALDLVVMNNHNAVILSHINHASSPEIVYRCVCNL